MGWWFKLRSKQLLNTLSLGEYLKLSAGWFDALKRWHKIVLRYHTYICQIPLSNKIQGFRRFHHDIRWKATSGSKDNLSISLGNLTCNRLPCRPDSFTICFYWWTVTLKKGKSVWVWENHLAMNKRQSTVQITLFVDGMPRAKPVVIFRETRKRITLAERVAMYLLICTSCAY